MCSLALIAVEMCSISVTVQRSLHNTPVCSVLDKDLKGKKKTIRLSQEAKSESLEASTKTEVEIGVDGFTR